ncbi:hypothetical protein CF54_15340 [Streptomyces sp. Tu 6176]|uniref:hypothetical protein n=1 Tax=Streptomyces sp. Tu 6176 TaxID=1470557 RepID=UPI0004486F85|nr:hypothetical protein [Streptomyces sp. Tu 6176]EYT82088.1 hypothetical protein CF54_15340 [Streptomyces sp. Tu 6176]
MHIRTVLFDPGPDLGLHLPEREPGPRIAHAVEELFVLTGTAYGAGDELPLTRVVLDGDRLTWPQARTEPMRLTPAFGATADGHTLRGTSGAGRLPASKVTGERRSALERRA